jgi:hypothetical protein
MKLKLFARLEKESGRSPRIQDVWDGLSQHLGVHESLVRLWAYNQRPMRPKYAIAIEEWTAGRVPRWEHCPDVYPPSEYKGRTEWAPSPQ